jgi:hypothetical protein
LINPLQFDNVVEGFNKPGHPPGEYLPSKMRINGEELWKGIKTVCRESIFDYGIN